MAGSSSVAVFQWGNKEAGMESSYESMCYNGVWYHLHDCVLCKSGMKKPFVGKLMRLFEDEGRARKVRIRWFFRPYELPTRVAKDLVTHIHNTNELFIVLGNVKGVENENFVEVIQRKAMVLCTARYGRNTIPSPAHIDAADFVFNRAYDVVNRKLVKMTNIHNKHLAQKFVNKPEWLIVDDNVEVEEPKSSTSPKNFGLVAAKRPISKTSSIDSSLSQEKKFKGKEKTTNYEV